MTNATPPPELSELLLTMADGLREAIFATVQAEGLLPPMALALRLLNEPMTMREIAETLSCDPSFVTQIADGLERTGLAERRSDLSDRRVKRLAITAKGKRVRARIESRVSTNFGGFDRLTESEILQLRRLLAKALTE